MIYKIMPALILFALFTRCKKDDDFEKKDRSGTVVNKSYVWKKPLTNYQWAFVGVFQLPIFEEKYITATHFGENAKLAAFDVFTGETVWEWSDYIGRDNVTVYLSMDWPYFHDNLMVYQHGPRSYCIDMATGRTLWKREDQQGFHSYLTGTGSEYLLMGLSGDTLGLEINTDFIGNINSGNKYPSPPPPNFWLAPNNPSNFAIASNGGALFEANSKKYLLSSYAKVTEHWKIIPFIGLYNRTDNRWEYSEKQLLPPAQQNSISNFPIVSKGVVVTSVGNHICANNLWTGDSIWAYDCGGGLDEGGFLIHEGHIYAMAKSYTLYCFDLHSGHIIWELNHEDLGYTSHMSHLNGILYFCNGTIMAVDMATGSILWSIVSPDDYAYKELAIYPGKDGKKSLILTATYQNAYCFEAIQ